MQVARQTAPRVDGHGLGWPEQEYFDALRDREFARLGWTGQTYLDHTGSALYPESLVTRHTEFLREHVLGNPHSENPAARTSTRWLERAREAVLRFFHADPAEYEVCFTANASAALKLVGESFPFVAGSRLVLSQDNHNSVIGLREFARRRGASVHYLPLDAELRLTDPLRGLTPVSTVTPSLFAFPAQSNFSGVRHPLQLVEQARERGYTVLLDAAAYAPGAALSLSTVRPDFMALSFYKMFGYPTGVGALLARRDAVARLQRPWFAGGTVEFVSTLLPRHQLLSGTAGFEDGTANFLAIAAVPAGLDFLERAGMLRVAAQLQQLTERLLRGLRSLRHGNGRSAVRIYGPENTRDRGGTVAFNLLDAEGRVVPFERVVNAAAARGIAVRGGCFCNPGAAESAFRYSAEQLRICLDRTQPDFSLSRLADCMREQAVGAVRASLGISSSVADIEALTGFLAEYCLADSRNDLVAAAS